MARTFDSPKDPQEVRDYGIDWAADIGEATIAAGAAGSLWSVVAGTVVIVSKDHDDTTTTIRLSGGTLGETCELLNHIVLSNGEEAEITCKLRVRAK